jgi:hypothetical protein
VLSEIMILFTAGYEKRSATGDGLEGYERERSTAAPTPTYPVSATHPYPASTPSHHLVSESHPFQITETLIEELYRRFLLWTNGHGLRSILMDGSFISIVQSEAMCALFTNER